MRRELAPPPRPPLPLRAPTGGSAPDLLAGSPNGSTAADAAAMYYAPPRRSGPTPRRPVDRMLPADCCAGGSPTAGAPPVPDSVHGGVYRPLRRLGGLHDHPLDDRRPDTSSGRCRESARGGWPLDPGAADPGPHAGGLLAVAGCSDDPVVNPVEVAQAEVAAKEKALADAEVQATATAAAFCEANPPRTSQPSIATATCSTRRPRPWATSRTPAVTWSPLARTRRPLPSQRSARGSRSPGPSRTLPTPRLR